MSGIENMNMRVNYRGGKTQNRMIQGKLDSLRSALNSSYQAATITLQDEDFNFTKKFRCLINPDKLKNDYDNKILSIPYEDICINSERKGKTHEGLEETLIKPGTVFHWDETDTDWIVYLQYKEEYAYFRAEIRQCEREIEVNDHIYKVYYRGPTETTIQWNLKKNTTWNDLNYSAVIYVTQNEETLAFFHRFNRVKVINPANPFGTKYWEVTVVKDSAGDGIIEVHLGETFQNEIEEAQKEYEENLPKPQKPEHAAAAILGESVVYPYDVKTYTIQNVDILNGVWELNNKKARIVRQTEDSVTIEITSGRSGDCVLSFKKDNEVIVSLPIEIKSL